jgi:hypothetical protein
MKLLFPFLLVIGLALGKRIFFPGYERYKWRLFRRVISGLLAIYWIIGTAGSIYIIHRMRRIVLLSIDAYSSLSVTSSQQNDLKTAVIYLDRRNWATSILFPFSHRQTLRALNLMGLAFGIDHWTQQDYLEWMRLSRSTTRTDWETLNRLAHEKLSR